MPLACSSTVKRQFHWLLSLPYPTSQRVSSLIAWKSIGQYRFDTYWYERRYRVYSQSFNTKLVLRVFRKTKTPVLGIQRLKYTGTFLIGTTQSWVMATSLYWTVLDSSVQGISGEAKVSVSKLMVHSSGSEVRKAPFCSARIYSNGESIAFAFLFFKSVFSNIQSWLLVKSCIALLFIFFAALWCNLHTFSIAVIQFRSHCLGFMRFRERNDPFGRKNPRRRFCCSLFLIRLLFHILAL